MTSAQKRTILEVSTQRAWKHQRRELRRIFVACQESGYEVNGYLNVLEEALIVAKRAVAAIDILRG
jgi:hypothetical protein